MHESFNLENVHNEDVGSVEGIKRLALKMREQIPTPTDYAESLFLDLAVNQGLLVTEPEIIKLSRDKSAKGDKLSTVPDFLVRRDLDDDGIYIEVTDKNARDAHKNRQRKVMVEAGLGHRYVQLVAEEIKDLQNSGGSLISYLESKLG